MKKLDYSNVINLDRTSPDSDHLRYLEPDTFPAWMAEQIEEADQSWAPVHAKLQETSQYFSENLKEMTLGNRDRLRTMFYYRGLFHWVLGNYGGAFADLQEFLGRAVMFAGDQVSFQNPEELPRILKALVIQGRVMNETCRMTLEKAGAFSYELFTQSMEKLGMVHLLISLKDDETLPDRLYPAWVNRQAYALEAANVNLFNVGRDPGPHQALRFLAELEPADNLHYYQHDQAEVPEDAAEGPDAPADDAAPSATAEELQKDLDEAPDDQTRVEIEDQMWAEGIHPQQQKAALLPPVPEDHELIADVTTASGELVRLTLPKDATAEERAAAQDMVKMLKQLPADTGPFLGGPAEDGGYQPAPGTALNAHYDRQVTAPGITTFTRKPEA